MAGADQFTNNKLSLDLANIQEISCLASKNVPCFFCSHICDQLHQRGELGLHSRSEGQLVEALKSTVFKMVRSNLSRNRHCSLA